MKRLGGVLLLAFFSATVAYGDGGFTESEFNPDLIKELEGFFEPQATLERNELGAGFSMGGGWNSSSQTAQFILAIEGSPSYTTPEGLQIQYAGISLNWVQSAGANPNGPHSTLMRLSFYPLGFRGEEIARGFNWAKFQPMPISIGTDGRQGHDFYLKLAGFRGSMEQEIPLGSMRLMVRQILEVMGYQFTRYFSGQESHRLDFAEARVEAQLKINNLFQVLIGARQSLFLEFPAVPSGLGARFNGETQIYGRLYFGVDLGGTAAQLFGEGGYRRGPAYAEGYFNLGLELLNHFNWSPQRVGRP